MNLSLPGLGMFMGGPKIPSPPPPQVFTPQPVKPTKTSADVEAAARKKQRAAMGAQASSGRASTLMAESGTEEKLGA